MFTALCIADRPPRKSILAWVQEHPIDLIITLGDLEYLQIVELGQITNIPKIGVYGNHCTPGYMEDLGIFNLHLQTFEFNGISFGGFEGSPRYKHDPYAKMYTDDEAAILLQQLPNVDVLISHSPPRGINDEDDPAHIGFQALRTYIEQKQPRYFLHGHTYPKPEALITKHLTTEIIYVNGDQLVEFH